MASAWRPWSRRSRVRLAAARNSQSLALCSSAMPKALRYNSSAAWERPLLQQQLASVRVRLRCKPALPCPFQNLRGIAQQSQRFSGQTAPNWVRSRVPDWCGARRRTTLRISPIRAAVPPD